MKQSPFPLVFREQVPLAPYTTLAVGGPARYFVEAAAEAHVIEALEFAQARNLPVFVLGGGSNVVVADSGFDGLVIRIALCGAKIKKSGDVLAAAGEEWDPLVRGCVEHCLAGIECLSGIPGTVGGTPVQNVGAYGQEVSQVIETVRVLDRKTQNIDELSNQECGFAYRSSIFNACSPDRYIVLSVRFRLKPGGAAKTDHTDLSRYFADRGDHPGLAEIREAVLKIRSGKSMVLLPGDPNCKTAGSFFKNPLVPPAAAKAAEEVARRAGTLQVSDIMPQYPMPDGTVKLSAAWLIERSGFTKGYRRGRVGLSSRHTLAIVNCGDATAEEIQALMREIQSAVRGLYGVDLVPEPVFVGY